MQHKSQVAARGDLFFADFHGDHSASPAPEVLGSHYRVPELQCFLPLLCTHLSFLTNFKQSDVDHELVNVGAIVPDP